MKQHHQISFEEAVEEMRKKREGEEPKDLLDVLLDQGNKDPIVLTDEKGKKLAFEQVAIIPYGVDEDKTLYVVLKPITKIKGIADDEAVVFKVIEDEVGNAVLRVEDDELIAIEIFNKYYDMLEEARKNDPKKSRKKRKGGTTT